MGGYVPKIDNKYSLSTIVTPGGAVLMEIGNHRREEVREGRKGIPLEVNCARGSPTGTVAQGDTIMDNHI